MRLDIDVIQCHSHSLFPRPSRYRGGDAYFYRERKDTHHSSHGRWPCCRRSCSTRRLVRSQWRGDTFEILSSFFRVLMLDRFARCLSKIRTPLLRPSRGRKQRLTPVPSVHLCQGLLSKSELKKVKRL